jgi:hypothetical protein
MASDARPGGAGAARATAAIVTARTCVASRYAAAGAKAALGDLPRVAHPETGVLERIERGALRGPADVRARLAAEARSIVGAAHESRLAIAIVRAVAVRRPALLPLRADHRRATIRIRRAHGRTVTTGGTGSSAIDTRLISVSDSVRAMRRARVRAAACTTLTGIPLRTRNAIVAGSAIRLVRAGAAHAATQRVRSAAKGGIAGRTTRIDAYVYRGQVEKDARQWFADFAGRAGALRVGRVAARHARAVAAAHTVRTTACELIPSTIAEGRPASSRRARQPEACSIVLAADEPGAAVAVGGTNSPGRARALDRALVPRGRRTHASLTRVTDRTRRPVRACGSIGKRRTRAYAR